jgi:hypothetical protein
VRPAVALGLLFVPIAGIVAARPACAQGSPRTAPPTSREVTRIELAFDVDRGLAGGTAVLRVLLRDAAGRATDAPLRVLADAGTVEEPERAGPGVYTARVTLPPVLGARRALLVIASAGSGSASVALPLAPGPAALLRVELPAGLAADGAVHPLWITVSDAHGNPASEVPRAEALRGSVSEPVSLASGGWVIDYRPPRDTSRGEDVLRLVAGAAASSTALPLAPMVPILSIAARGGAVLGTDRPAVAFGAEAVTWFEARPLDLDIGLALAATWWGDGSRSAVQSSGGDLDLNTHHSWLPLTLSVALRRALGARAVGTLLLGGGAALVTSRAALAGQPALSEAGWAPVASAGVEIALRQRVGEVFAGAQGAWIGGAGLDTLRGTAWPIFLHLGYRFHAR